MTTAKPAKKALIVMAMRGESEPIARRLGLDLARAMMPFAPLPSLWLDGSHKGHQVAMVINGIDGATNKDMIGSQAAAVTALSAIRKFEPDLILNFGTCGALGHRGSQVGDMVLVCDRVWYHTRRIPLPGWEAMGLGGYPAAGTAALAAKLGFKAGVLSTTDSLDFAPVDAEVFRKVNADVADMEGAAIAWLASLHGVPFYSLKGVTDLMDSEHKAGVEFERNFAMVVEKLADASLRLMNEIL